MDPLVALGPVLLLERARAPERGSLIGCRPERLQPRITVEPEGICEELVVLDQDGTISIRVVRLPDSDYFGWERVLCEFGGCVASVSGDCEPVCRPGIHAGVARNARRRECWIARAVRFRPADDGTRGPVPVPVHWGSWVGLRVIDRLREREDIALAP